MRIGIDARLILDARMGGAQYTYYLTKNLLNIDKKNTYILFYNFMRRTKGRMDTIKEFVYPNVESKIVRFPGDALIFLWNKFGFPSLDSIIGKMDLFHYSIFRLDIPPVNCKWVATIHHVIPENFRHFEYSLNEIRIKKYYQKLKSASSQATLVIIPSAVTKKQLIEEFNFPEDKIRVTPEAAGDIFRPIEDKALLKERLDAYGISEKYILYAGGSTWNKNLSRLIDAFTLLKKGVRREYKLVFVGKRGWGYEELLLKIHQMGLEDRVIFTDYVPEDDLVYLYNGAEFFIYPSLWEGFGLSAIEAMACGCPVAASNIPVFKEVIQESGLYFDPEDVEDIAQAMFKLIEDDNLRQNLQEKGSQRAKFFSWEKTARETLNVYKEAVER